MNKNCLIVAGEKSGEEHLQTIFPALKNLVPEVAFWGIGGDQLKSLQVELIYHLKDFSSWGISEVIFKVPFYLKALKVIEDQVKKRKTKVAILVDFQDFNLRLAIRLKKLGVEVLYMVAPQAWVWRRNRAKVLAKVVHTLFTLIPFEKKWFENRGVKRVIGITHPIATRLGQYQPKKKDLGRQTLLLLPGSRNFEVKNLLPQFILAALNLKKKFNLSITLVASSNVDPKYYQPYYSSIDKIYSDDLLGDALMSASVALAASGTVTLTTAFFAVPTIVCYKVSLLNELLFQSFLNYNGMISLANIYHQQEVFPELLQDMAHHYFMEEKLSELLNDNELYREKVAVLEKTKDLLQGDQISLPEYFAKVINEVN